MAKGVVGAEIRTQITGWKALQRQLQSLENKSQKKVMRKALRGGGKVVLQQARRDVPVETGQLKKNTKLSVTVKKGEASASIGFTEEGYYGRFVEQGTSSQPAQPFLRPALLENQSQINDAFAEAFQAALNEVARG